MGGCVMTKINVAIVDDNEKMVSLLDAILQTDKNIEVIGRGDDGVQALDIIKNQEPDVVLLDLIMPKLDGLEVMQQVNKDMSLKKRPAFIVISAIGNHDEATAQPIDAISAALILADKTDVRRSRVRNTDFLTFDIHDRVNYAVETAELLIDKEQQEFVLSMTIDTQISSVLEYFEIFMERMLLCRRAAQFFHMQFKIYINHSLML